MKAGRAYPNGPERPERRPAEGQRRSRNPEGAATDADGDEALAPVWRRRLVFVLTVIVVPTLASAAMVGAALQLIGFPVWQTVEHWVHPPSKNNPVLESTRLALRADEARIRVLTAQLRDVENQLSLVMAQRERLLQANRRLQSLLVQRQNQSAAARQEAFILTQMDPGPAAQLLDRMPLDAAARVVAQMTPDAAAQVLAALPADKAQQILAQSAVVKASAKQP